MAEGPAFLSELENHLLAVQADETKPLDSRLFSSVEGQVTDSNVAPLTRTLLPRLIALLSQIQQDPTPLIPLTERLLIAIPFTSCLELTTPSAITEALSSPISSVNMLAFTLLQRATSSPSDIAILAGMKDVIGQAIETWLTTSHTEVSSKAESVLHRLLSLDYDSKPAGDIDIDMERLETSSGQGLLWRRIFGDKDIYSLIFSKCSLKASASDGQPSKKSKTIAQARLLSLLPKLARLDFDILTRSNFPEVEAHYALPPGREGLLEFAATGMVETKDDVLMHMTLIDFFSDLLLSVRPGDVPLSSSTSSLSARMSSPCLDFLTSHGLHERTVQYYLAPGSSDVDQLEVSFLNSHSARYLAALAANYPEYILQERLGGEGQFTLDLILVRIREALNQSPAHRDQNSPVFDLHLLASLPSVCLLPQFSRNERSTPQVWFSSPLSLIPLTPPVADYYNTLATLFRGPLLPGDLQNAPTPFSHEASYSNPKLFEAEAAAARALYYLYLGQHPDLYTHVVRHATTLALKDTAFSALSLMAAIINANWTMLPDEESETSTRYQLPTEQRLNSLLPVAVQRPLATSGITAMLQSPALETVIPFLLLPPTRFNKISGEDSVAYKWAVMKYDILVKLNAGLKEIEGDGLQGVTELRRKLVSRIKQGPWPRDAPTESAVQSLSS